MWYHVFPCLLCLSVFQAFCHLVWPPRFSCIFAFFLTCSCMCLCLFILVIKHHSYHCFHAGSHPSFYMKSWVLFRIFAWWKNCHLYSNMLFYVLACLTTCFIHWGHLFHVLSCSKTCFLHFAFVHMFSTFDSMFVCPFCMFIYFYAPYFHLFLCLFAGFVICSFVTCTHGAWEKLLSPHKWAVISKLWDLALPRGPFFPSLSI